MLIQIILAVILVLVYAYLVYELYEAEYSNGYLELGVEVNEKRLKEAIEENEKLRDELAEALTRIYDPEQRRSSEERQSYFKKIQQRKRFALEFRLAMVCRRIQAKYAAKTKGAEVHRLKTPQADHKLDRAAA